MLAGKTALITGASGGLGRAIAFEMAKKGCHLFLVGRDLEKLYTLHADIKKEHDVPIESKSVDMAIDMEMGYLLSQAGNRIDILINNAGMFPIKTIAESSNEDFDKCFAVNVRSPFILSVAEKQASIVPLSTPYLASAALYTRSIGEGGSASIASLLGPYRRPWELRTLGRIIPLFSTLKRWRSTFRSL